MEEMRINFLGLKQKALLKKDHYFIK